jgi:hypothetical protein
MFVRYLALASATSIGLTAQISVAPIDDSLKSYISILTYGTAAFDGALQELLPASSRPATGHVQAGSGPTSCYVPTALPYCVIVQDISGEPLLGIHVVFRTLGMDGKTFTYSYLSTNTDPINGPVLKPNGYRSYSPLENTDLEYLSRLRQITVSIEWVIIPTGVFLGPDTFGQFNTIKSRQEAESWLVSRLTPLLTSPSALRAELEALSATQVAESRGLFQQDVYNRTVRDAARLISRLMQTRIDAPGEYLTHLARQIPVIKQ